MDVHVGDIWIYDNRGEYTYWLVYKTDRDEDENDLVYYLSKVGGKLDTTYRRYEFLDAKQFWTLALRVK